jgi:hypothetical protein
MTKQRTTDCLKFQGLFEKTTVVKFDEERASSNGGELLLRAIDTKLGLTKAIAAAITDPRQSTKINHTMDEMLAQRVYAIACGYPDCNDAGTLARDPMHIVSCGRSLTEEYALASQPTLSRLENRVTNKDLYRMGAAFMRRIVSLHAKRLKHKAKLITIDMDPTDNATHGAQQLSFFNGHYDTWCYLPVVAFVSFDKEHDQHLLGAVLRPGNAHASHGAIAILSRIINELRKKFPKAKIRLRLDGGFATPELFDFLDAQGVEYLINMAKNAVLKRYAEKLMKKARSLSKKSGVTEKFYAESLYRAGSWKITRRVIFKAEVVRHEGRLPKDNPRFVITNMKQSARYIYEEIYCKRGEVENRIKELQCGLAFDRTSCNSFKANQFRILLTALAYALLQQIRLAAKGTALARAQVSTLRLFLLKLSARIESSVRRFVIHLPKIFPHHEDFRKISIALGASG